MDDLPEKLRQHYLGQSLSPEALERIRRRAEPRRPRYQLANGMTRLAAAALALVIGLYFFIGYYRRVELIDVRLRVAHFFSRPDYQLDQMSPDPHILRAWLIQHGAPADTRLPRGLEHLPSVGCAVLKVDHQPVFILCFDAGSILSTNIDDQPAPKPGVTAVGAMMKKNKPGLLVHLIVIPFSALRDRPVERKSGQIEKLEHLSFVEWADEGAGIAYLVASRANALDLQLLLQKSSLEYKIALARY